MYPDDYKPDDLGANCYPMMIDDPENPLPFLRIIPRDKIPGNKCLLDVFLDANLRQKKRMLKHFICEAPGLIRLKQDSGGWVRIKDLVQSSYKFDKEMILQFAKGDPKIQVSGFSTMSVS